LHYGILAEDSTNVRGVQFGLEYKTGILIISSGIASRLPRWYAWQARFDDLMRKKPCKNALFRTSNL
jgi:hypothetical protein